MHSALAQFRANLASARDLGVIGRIVTQVVTVGVDVSDIWRAQIVCAVSALDHLVHEIVRIGMIEASKGARTKSDAFLRFQIPLKVVDQAILGRPHEEWVGDAVRAKHSWLSFQQPDKIADAIRLISQKALWDEVGHLLGMAAKDVKLQLELIVDRRNKIAHEADMDPANPGFRWPITDAMAESALVFVEKVADAIVKVAT